MAEAGDLPQEPHLRQRALAPAQGAALEKAHFGAATAEGDAAGVFAHHGGPQVVAGPGAHEKWGGVVRQGTAVEELPWARHNGWGEAVARDPHGGPHNDAGRQQHVIYAHAMRQGVRGWGYGADWASGGAAGVAAP